MCLLPFYILSTTLSGTIDPALAQRLASSQQQVGGSIEKREIRTWDSTLLTPLFFVHIGHLHAMRLLTKIPSIRCRDAKHCLSFQNPPLHFSYYL